MQNKMVRRGVLKEIPFSNKTIEELKEMLDEITEELLKRMYLEWM
jgi:DNA replication protein DnaC